MFKSIAWIAPTAIGAIYALTPFAVHSSFCVAARCKLASISVDRLPKQISEEFSRRISEFAVLGFELVGTFDCGVLTNDTHSYVACFCHHATNEFANVTAMSTPIGPASYFEFSSQFSNGRSIETNSNAVLPLMPVNPDIRIFRFESITELRTLLQVHRQLAEKYAPGLCPLGEPRDAEVQRYVRTVEAFGPRLVEAGYMRLGEGGDNFRLTWRGAIRMAWFRLWPVTLFRKAIHHHAMQLELQSLQTRTEAALQKA